LSTDLSRLTGKNPFKSQDNKQMLLNNYMCNINYQEIECKKTTQDFMKRLLEKDPNRRPSAKLVLEDDIFCSAESNIQLDLEFLTDKHLNPQKAEFEPYNRITKIQIDSMFRSKVWFES
jgi:serine/threonine protein kinase